MMPNSFVRLSTYLFAVAITVGCTAARVKDDKPLPVDDPEAYGIVYLVKASAADLRKASSEQLRSRYGQSFIRTETGVTGYGTPFWNMSTDYREYRLNGKRYRSQCAVHCFPFRQFPQYVDLSVSCKLDTHDLRSTFHGFPSWGWHKEQGLHLAHELITDIVRGAAIPESHLIRLRRHLTYEAKIKLIEARESNKPNPTVEPDVRNSDTRGSP
jgi:hypothetical protein